MLTAFLVATTLQTQTPAPPATDATAERAAAAAEKAAAAAEKAAEASTRMADAVERLSESLGKAPPAAAAPAAEEKKEAAPKEDPWRGSVGLGLIALSGNASTLTFNGLASAERKTKDWIYSAKLQAVYGRSTLPATETEEERSQVVALAASFQVRGDRRFTQVVSGYLLGGLDTDHIKSVEVRGTGEAGASITWWDEKDEKERVSLLRTDLAFRYFRETRFQYYPTRMDLEDVDLGGPRVGVTLSYGLSKDIIFTEEAEAVPNVLGESRLLVNSTSKLSARLTESLSLGTSLVIRYDSEPPVGKLSTDTALSASVEVAF